jgi:hypothetical protein
MSQVRIFAILLLSFGLCWLATISIRSDSVYQSVHSAGHRFSTIVPSGKDIGSQKFDDQYVRIEPAMYYKTPPKLSSPLPPGLKPLARFETGRNEHVLVPMFGVFIMMCALMSVSVVNREQSSGSQRERGLMYARITLVYGLCTAACVLGLMLFRLFLTGVDDGLIERASVTGASGNVFHYAQQTLSMSFVSLIMLYAGAGIMLYLVLTWFGIRMHGVSIQEHTLAEESNGFVGPRLLRTLGYATLACANLYLILAPWTNTMFGKFFG